MQFKIYIPRAARFFVFGTPDVPPGIPSLHGTICNVGGSRRLLAGFNTANYTLALSEQPGHDHDSPASLGIHAETPTGTVLPQEKLSLFQRVRAAVWPAAVAPDGADAALLSEAAPEPPEPPVGLRVFHSVALHNADMLIPGAVARFTFVDKLLIWLPIAIGLCSALYKIFTSVRHTSACMSPMHVPTWIHAPTLCTPLPTQFAINARLLQMNVHRL